MFDVKVAAFIVPDIVVLDGGAGGKRRRRRRKVTELSISG